jgi:phage/plasmid-like protein (TIGR03299 family)
MVRSDAAEMAHELLVENGKAAMFYVDGEPWHKLGTKLEAPPTSRQAIQAAKLDWNVAKMPLYVAGGTRLHELRDRFALVREDTLSRPDCTVFGIAGRDYVPLQNADAFEFFDPIVKSGQATYETAGALGRGERVWVLAGDLCVTERDMTRKYLLLSNSHDGTSSLQVKLTPVRVVCNNTLTLALGQGGTFRVRHDKDIKEGLERTRTLLGLVQDTYSRLERLFQAMAKAKVEQAAAEQYLIDVFPDPQDGNDVTAAARVSNRRKCALYLFRHGRGNEDLTVHGTIWAAYNGVTELIDHRKSTPSGPDFTPRRLHSLWFGQGAAIKARALRLAIEWVRNASPS